MIRRQFNNIANNPHEDLRVVEEFPDCVTVEYTPPRKEINASRLSEEDLLKNNLTDNTALIEIRTPKTPLLQKREYRGDVYGPSADLSGSVTRSLIKSINFRRKYLL